ncbi:helix-turn-helix transcriptional regulator [Deinococcus cavernae]|nr:helix-turn-helix transcriptional regulator [Deinococcus cavernae]
MLSVNDQNFSQLLGIIYDAALHPESWQTVLEQLPRFSQTNVLNFVELQLNDLPVPGKLSWVPLQSSVHGLSREGEASLMADWAYRIPLTYDLINLTLKDQRAVATPAQTSPQFDFGNSEFCHECALPNDFYHMLGVSSLSSDRQSLFILSMNRPRRYGHFSNADAQLLHSLLPHLSRAQQIGQQLRAMQLVQGLQAAALDHCAAPVLGLNVRGKLLYANAAAEALLHTGTVLRLHYGTLQATQPGEHQALIQALHRASLLGRDVQGRPDNHLTFSRDGRPPLSGLLLPMPKLLMPKQCPARGFTLLLKDPVARRTPPLLLLQHLYALTAAEARVATLLTDGLTLDEIGAHLGTATATVRNQLKQVFAKTGARRQGDLIRLIMNLS